MNIKATIKAHHMTINEVAVKMGINRVSLSQTISNNPTYSTLSKIADVLGCDVMDFFKDEATHQPVGDDFIALVRAGGQTVTFESKDALKAFVSTL